MQRYSVSEPMIDQPAYQHTQRAPLCLILYAFAILEFILAWTLRHQQAIPWLMMSIGVLMLILAASFHYLRVSDSGDKLLVSFGPLPLFRRVVRYDDIASAEVGRTWLLDGWGIHWRLGEGGVWNIWGRDCVVLRMKKETLRIGSDDARNLAAFLQTRARPLQ